MKKPRLNQRMSLEAPSRVPDGAGGHRTVWTAVGTVWVSLDARSGRESLAGGRETAEVRGRIVMRSAPLSSPRRPSPDCRFRQGDRIFGIEAVRPMDPAGAFLICDVIEGAFA